MLRRILPVLCVLSVVAAACGRPEIDVAAVEPEEGALVPLVVDVEGDAGHGVSISTDPDGNPHLAYLAFPEEAEGEEAPAPDPLAPILPAVLHAHLVQDVWTRGPVTDDLGDLTPDDATGIAVDAEGTHHIAWTVGGELFYTDDPSGEAEPQAVTPAASSPAVAAGEDGTPWIAFWEEQTEPEGPTALLRIATPAGDGWEVETVAEGEPSDPASIGLEIGTDGPIVAYGSAGVTQVATRQGARWASQTVDPEGGAGVAMDLDADGNPHLSYLGPGGAVKHAHSIDGSPWEISPVGEGATGSPTTIALDDGGVHHVAWATEPGLAYATNAEGEFAAVELPPATAGGIRPRVAAGTPEQVVLAWYDPVGTELQMLVSAETDPLLAVPPPPEDAGGAAPPAACQPEGTELAIAAQALAFDTDCLAAPAGEAFTIEFDNQDAGVPHNVAIYESPAAAQDFFVGETFPGVAAMTYDVDPIDEEGNLFFRCDVHPTTMTGAFVVA